jgi:hypothetical protein
VLQAFGMLRQVVDSSSLRSIGYDRSTSALEVEFLNGAVYRYEDVPPELWTEFRSSGSKGQFFQQRVRDRFPTTRIPP